MPNSTLLRYLSGGGVFPTTPRRAAEVTRLTKRREGESELGKVIDVYRKQCCRELMRTGALEQPILYLGALFVSTLAALGLSLLLLKESQRSYRASDFTTLYLLASTLCDVIILAAPSQVDRHAYISRAVSFRCCIHSMLLVIECCTKRHAASDAIRKQRAPEERHGILSRIFFLWINPILLQWYTNVLVNQDLPPLSQYMKPELTREAMIQAWSKVAKPETKMSLPLALMKCVKQPFLAAIVPRLFLIIFQYSQPILIRESIRYVVAYPTNTESNQGFWLVLSAIAVYLGLALSTAVYQHRKNRLKLMTRSCLVGVIHHKIINSPAVSYDNGEATTLMSTDADSLDDVAGMVHEIWAHVIEVIIGIGLLASQVGWIWPLPLLLIYLCSYMSRFVTKNLQPRQKAWNSTTQSRIAAISSMLSSMKVVKMLGYQHNLVNRIQELRGEELWAASKLRWIMVYYNMSANALGIFSPAITLVISALISVARGGRLDTETAFTTIAILSMVTHPANMVMTIVPRVVAAFAGFERIQAFLLQPSLQDTRQILQEETQSSPAIQIRDVQIGHESVVLQNINIEVAPGSFTIISGPTGSGKSNLLRAILGEVTPTQGSISLSTRNIAYCAQKP
ncbi:oligomycin resistance ATP-dependent permease yor1, putative [Talaromyces stipitatus ATCC 10500]|uniref:Oligomycin resistance ATP-dependent permease yor1, putative n=1 Tax=Talaromyces stipitatus (strain ATCC 10500 / CBS 375.48 / QM 6759 / NRRL 1006) TaxID=441959 RepID=B8M5K0_TALSN|nr:oligomycin resistance ATP-dependent permease yor1, putative [Talaromyces stipitatus ATCC 10500]EED19894.1 oligomycin resistance ATP-dependent permease yor1, putative [Talaromyces stipitatus ATCC 10500]